MRQGYAIIVRSGDQALEYLHLFGIVGSWFLFLGLEMNVWAREAAWRNTCSGSLGKGGGASLSSHLTFLLESPKQGTQNNRASRSQLHWICFPKKKETETEDSRVKNPALQRCERDQWGTGVFASGGRETPAFLALGCQVVGSAGRGHTCLVAPSTC